MLAIVNPLKIISEEQLVGITFLVFTVWECLLWGSCLDQNISYLLFQNFNMFICRIKVI